MEESALEIRQQMADTRAQLSEKLHSLEHQVSETVQSTGTAVNATVGAVQETVESVTGAVQDALKSVSNSLDLQQQIAKHPWLVLGGSVVLGYLASELIERNLESSPSRHAANTGPTPYTAPTPNAGQSSAAYEQPQYASSVGQPAKSASAESTGSRSNPMSAAWQQITNAATEAAIGMLQEAAALVVPQIVDYIHRSTLPTATAAGRESFQEPNHSATAPPTV